MKFLHPLESPLERHEKVISIIISDSFQIINNFSFYPHFQVDVSTYRDWILEQDKANDRTCWAGSPHHTGFVISDFNNSIIFLIYNLKQKWWILQILIEYSKVIKTVTDKLFLVHSKLTFKFEALTKVNLNIGEFSEIQSSQKDWTLHLMFFEKFYEFYLERYVRLVSILSSHWF